MNTLEEQNKLHNVNTVAVDTTQSKLTEFADVGEVISVGDDVITVCSLGPADQSLIDFFSRPLKLYNGTDNAFTTITFNPLTSYFANPAIVRKVSNYRYMRFTLNLRYSESYNPYVYGRRYMVLMPNITNKLIEFPSYTSLANVEISPNTADTYELKLPFTRVSGVYYPVPDLLSGSVSEYVLNIYQPVAYKMANGDPIEGQFSVHAWLTDVELVVPVASGTLQSGKFKEYKGMVSAPATAVKNAARELSKAPQLRAFALPLEVAAGVVSDVASLFGFSKPTQLESPEPFLNNPHYNMFISSAVDPAQKVTLDGKQQVVVSTQAFDGSVDDNLSFKNFTQRPAVIQDRIWTIAFPADTVIGYIPVTPLYNYLITPSRLALSPLAEVASMFKYWRGSITYRISVIASKFHRGRLRIFWSPAKLTVPFTEPISNLVESYIMDITTETDVEITIKYGNNLPYSLMEPLTAGEIHTFGTNPGYLYITVHQELSAPVNTADAWVYISMHSDDIEFAEPTSSFLSQYNNGTIPEPGDLKIPSDSSLLTPYAGFEPESWPPSLNFESGALVERAKKPRKHVFNAESNHENANKLYIGESILSYRTLCKSYLPMEYGEFPPNTGSVDIWSYLSFPTLPKLSGVSFGGTVGLKCARNPLTYLLNSFNYTRGSIRYKIVFYPEDSAQGIDRLNLTAYRVRGFDSNKRFGGTYSLEDVSINCFYRRAMQGVALDFHNNSITFEIPYTTYKNYNRTTMMGGDSSPDGYNDQVIIMATMRPGTTLTFQSYVSIGEDFNVVHYMGQGSVFLGDVYQ